MFPDKRSTTVPRAFGGGPVDHTVFIHTSALDSPAKAARI